MASSPTRLMTFAEFELLPATSRGFPYELRHGEPVHLPPPKHEHYLAQRRLERLLANALGRAGEVGIGLGFRPLPEHEYWLADVAFVAHDRWNRISPKGNLEGAPDLVVEVLSPSNSAAEMLARGNIFLANGSREFWLVDIEHRQVELSTPDGHSITYRSGQQIPLSLAPTSHIAVDSMRDLTRDEHFPQPQHPNGWRSLSKRASPAALPFR